MRQHKWRTGRILGIVMAAVMLGGIATPICAVAEESEAVEMQDGEIQDDGILEYVALGDSISNGYSADPKSEIISYPQLIAHDLEEMAGEDV